MEQIKHPTNDLQNKWIGRIICIAIAGIIALLVVETAQANVAASAKGKNLIRGHASKQKVVRCHSTTRCVRVPRSACEWCTTRDPRWIICRVWGPKHCRAALTVAWCEGSFYPFAENGQYRGTFQMGASERARFGHGPNLWAQARAAHRYWNLSGWGPWECRP